MAEIKETDKIVIIDESTTKTKPATKKTKYENGTKNIMKKSAKTYLKNFLSVLGLNVESNLFVVKTLDEFEFAKALFRIKRVYADSDDGKKILNNIILKCDISKREITKKFEERDSNPEFINKLTRSLKNNENDKSMILTRKLGKHCKRESTENTKIREEIKKEHYFELIEQYNVKEQFKDDRLVLMLDNAPSHTSSFVLDIAEKLNIIFVPLPKYAPWLNCVEKVWDIIKYQLKLSIIRSSPELVNIAFKTFNEKCMGDSLTDSFKEKYEPFLC